MKSSFFLIMILLLISCQNENKEKNKNEGSPAKSIPTDEFQPIELEVYIDDFKMRSGPGVQHEEVARLKENDMVTFSGEESMHSTPIKLRGVQLNATWLKVKTRDGVDGWIYGGGIKPATTASASAKMIIHQKQMNSFLDKKNIDQVKTYATQWNNIKTSNDFAKTYFLGEQTQQSINETLDQKVQIDDPGRLIDMSWLENTFIGYQNSLVAEATMFNIFKDFKIMHAKAKETEGTEDEDFITFQFHINELDSVEYFYKSWFMQTWDYGGHSLLGQGKHFNLLKEADELLTQSKLFEKSIMETKTQILNDIASEHTTFWEPKDKIVAEMKKIIDADFNFLTKEDKILLKTRYEQFQNPTANNIEVNHRAF